MSTLFRSTIRVVGCAVSVLMLLFCTVSGCKKTSPEEQGEDSVVYAIRQAVRKPEWREVKGNNWWSKNGWFGDEIGYHTEQQAFEAAFRESYWKYEWGEP
jgi:hypothetical protein